MLKLIQSESSLLSVCLPALPISIRKQLRLLTGSFMVLFISACASMTSIEHWPKSIPERSLFVEAYETQKALSPQSYPNEFNSHLMWVKRFYLGSPIYATGWKQMTATLLDTINDSSIQDNIRDRMHDLGIKICLQWAQDNSVRRIDSTTVAIWGNGLSKSAEVNEQLSFVTKVEKDVDALIAGTLNMKQISSDRYYPNEDFDNF